MTTPKMTVKNYADARGLTPQLVHYYIRQGYITTEACDCCGTKVIDVRQADSYVLGKEYDKED